MRDRFPIFCAHPDLIYLDSAATAHKPREVVDTLSQFYAEEYATVHRAIYRPSLLATEKYNLARKTAQTFLHAAHEEEIIFTRGTTDAINLVAQSYGRTFLKKGDEILISTMEHHSNIVPWQLLAEQSGAILRWIPMTQEGVLDWEGSITERTKFVSLAHVSNVTGTINPIRTIAAAAHTVGAKLLVDGAQAAPHMPIDVLLLDCDFYAFSGHKCYGPSGIGILYGKQELLEAMPPVQGGGDMIERVELTKSSYRAPPLRFEAGTPPIASAIGLKSALDFLEEVGRDAAAAHGQELLAAATEQLKTISGLKILGEALQKGPLISFVIEGIHPLDLTALLDLKNIALRSGHLCAQPCLRSFGLESVARASFGLYNSLTDIERLYEALEESVASLR